MNDEQMAALLAWEYAAKAEIEECEKELAAKHEYERVSLNRSQLTLEAVIAKARYKLIGGKVIE